MRRYRREIIEQGIEFDLLKDPRRVTLPPMADLIGTNLLTQVRLRGTSPGAELLARRLVGHPACGQKTAGCDERPEPGAKVTLDLPESPRRRTHGMREGGETMRQNRRNAATLAQKRQG